MTELRCPRDLALRLGSCLPVDARDHRRMRDSGDYLLVRDAAGWPLFWPLQLSVADAASARSS